MISVKEMLGAGWSLVPIPFAQKAPVHPGWNRPENCISKADQASMIVGGNLGLAHAYCSPSPTCAIDIDNFQHARVWLRSYGIELRLLLQAPDAVVIWSGKRFSIKLLYKLPEGSPALESKKINGIDGKTALEFRCGTKDGMTVQDVLPPSMHPNGNQYRWLGSGSPLILPAIEDSLLQVWHLLISNRARVADRESSEVGRLTHRLESPREIATIKDALSYISADCPYEQWRNIVWAILSTGWSCAESIAKAWSEGAAHRYSDDAFWLLVNSYIPSHENKITAGTIIFHARKGGWHG